MGIFDFLKRSRNREHETTADVKVAVIPTEESPKLFGTNGPFREYNYVRMADRKNRYELVITENIVNDTGSAEQYERGLLDKLTCYDNMICPSCGSQLERIPKAKMKCPICREYMHVVKSYIELDKSMLLTPDEKDTLKKHRDFFFKLKQISKDLDNLGITRKDYDRARNEMNPSFSYRDVVWKLLNDKSLEEFNNRRLGLHSNIHRFMGQFLKDEERYKAALQQYLYVCYLDLNGSMNYSMRSTLKNSFVLDTGFIVPGIVEEINDCMEKSSMTIEEVEIEFMQLERRNIPTPLTVSKSWSRFMKEYKQLIK